MKKTKGDGPITITSNELIDALYAARTSPIEHPEGAMTVEELRGSTGWGTRRVRARLSELKAKGSLAVVTVQRETLDGRTVNIPAYVMTTV